MADAPYHLISLSVLVPGEAVAARQLADKLVAAATQAGAARALEIYPVTEDQALAIGGAYLARIAIREQLGGPTIVDVADRALLSGVHGALARDGR